MNENNNQKITYLILHLSHRQKSYVRKILKERVQNDFPTSQKEGIFNESSFRKS